MASEDCMWQYNGSVHTCQVQAGLNSACEAFLTSDQRDWGRYTPGILSNCCLEDFNRQKRIVERTAWWRRCGYCVCCLIASQGWAKIFTPVGCCNGWYKPFRKVRLGGGSRVSPLSERAVGMPGALPWGGWWARGGQDYQEDVYCQCCGGCLPWTPWLGRRSGGLQAAGRSLVCTGPLLKFSSCQMFSAPQGFSTLWGHPAPHRNGFKMICEMAGQVCFVKQMF